MEASLRAAVEALIDEQTGDVSRIVGSQPASGGCIHRAEIVELSDGRRYFVKSNPSLATASGRTDLAPTIFEREAKGLAALAATRTIRVPRPLGTGAEPMPFLVMEAIDTGRRRGGFFTDFGRRFARLHLANNSSGSRRVERFGFDHDNHIGATPQPNPWTESWTDFFRHHRLGHQLSLARGNGLSDSTLERLGERLLERLDELVGEPNEPPCLLHGDLWSGNYMVDATGEPALIDPAAYYGRREADLAMTHLFGGFDSTFYAAYEEIWPLAPGSGERIELYKLYHLLNHLNLFGRGYRDGCVSILKRFAG